jgi:thiosulfate dehydrogenase (quinone) large subunit
MKALTAFFRPHNVEIQDPPLAKFIFNNTAFSLVWLVARLYIASVWIQSGWGKINNPKWVETGEALQGYWVNAVKVDPKPVIYFDWYRGFIQYLLDTQAYTWFAKVIAYGEVLVGIALILGAFVGIAAFFGAFMNFNFMLAGTASSNPVLFILSLLLILAWKTAGYYGLDRVLLPMLGTPWKIGYILNPNERTPHPTPLKA